MRNCWPSPSAQKCVGDFCYKFWRVLPPIFLEDFSGHFYPQIRRKNPARKSVKKSGGPKAKIRKKSVLPKTDPNNCCNHPENISSGFCSCGSKFESMGTYILIGERFCAPCTWKPRTGLLRTFWEPDRVLRSLLRGLCVQGALSCPTRIAFLCTLCTETPERAF